MESRKLTLVLPDRSPLAPTDYRWWFSQSVRTRLQRNILKWFGTFNDIHSKMAVLKLLETKVPPNQYISLNPPSMQFLAGMNLEKRIWNGHNCRRQSGLWNFATANGAELSGCMCEGANYLTVQDLARTSWRSCSYYCRILANRCGGETKWIQLGYSPPFTNWATCCLLLPNKSDFRFRNGAIGTSRILFAP
jgi:hypothetical protein